VFVRSAAFGQYVNGCYVAMLRRLAHLDHCSACDLITTHVLPLFIRRFGNGHANVRTAFQNPAPGRFKKPAPEVVGNVLGLCCWQVNRRIRLVYDRSVGLSPLGRPWWK
jgi:hypothetical protein